MNLLRAAFVAAISIASFLYAAQPAFEFSGVMTSDGRIRLALTDTITNTTNWVEPGDRIDGYTVTRYDAQEGAIFLQKAGEESRLNFARSKGPVIERPA